jgi:hypothetical protein
LGKGKVCGAVGIHIQENDVGNILSMEQFKGGW